jgi:hypothetical protein
MEIIVPAVANAFRHLKDYNEVMMARELYRFFDNSADLMKPLRLVGRVALKYIVALGEYLEQNKMNEAFKVFMGTIKKEKTLKIFGDQGIAEHANMERLRMLSGPNVKLSLNDISETLRLLGGVIEDVSKKATDRTKWIKKKKLGFTTDKHHIQPLHAKKGKDVRQLSIDNIWDITFNVKSKGSSWPMPALGELEEIRKAYRTIYDGADYKRVTKKMSKKDKDDIFAAQRGRGGEEGGVQDALPFKGSRRMRDMAVQHPDTGDVQFIDKKSFKDWEKRGYRLRPLSPDQKKYVMTSPGDKNGWAIRGMTLWKLKEGSTVWAMDRIFGLPPGADISGTTGDMMALLEVLINILYPPQGQRRVGVIDENDITEIIEVLYLFPFAAMVSLYHHTVLEMALTLSFNDPDINYQVGYYTTLLPERVAKRNNKTCRGVYNILKKWENHPTNLKVVYYTEDGSTWGAVCSTEEDLKQYREIASVSKHYNEFDKRRKKKTISLSDLRAMKLNVEKPNKWDAFIADVIDNRIAMNTVISEKTKVI